MAVPWNTKNIYDNFLSNVSKTNSVKPLTIVMHGP